MKYSVIAIFLLQFLLAGCANQNSIYRTFNLANGESPMIDIRQRAILVSPATPTRGVAVCAEPSPDAMAALAYELAAKANVADKGSIDIGMGMHDSAAFTGLRTQSIQLLRDFGYRLCESYLSGAISEPQYDLLMRRFQKNTVALLAIEQLTGTIKVAPVAITSSGSASTGKALAEQRLEREKIDDQLSALAAQKTTLNTELTEAKKTAGKDTSEIDKKIAALQAKEGRLQADLKAMDNAIANARDVLVSGQTNIVVQSNEVSSRSDTQLAAVAAVVQDIVNNIVLSDDKAQICYEVLQLDDAKLSELRQICAKDLAAQAEFSAVQTGQLRIAQSILLRKLNNAHTQTEISIVENDLTELGRKIESMTPKIYSKDYSQKIDLFTPSQLQRPISDSQKSKQQVPKKIDRRRHRDHGAAVLFND
jgi:hypothetical protein